MTEREGTILRLIEQHRYLQTGMIHRALFRFPSGRDKAWQVLRGMHRRGLVNRFRIGRGEYIYHLGSRSKKWRHWLDLARFHFALLDELKSWQKILYWQPEVKYPFGIADGLYIVKLTIDGGKVTFFLEVDDGNNPFDKVMKYKAYYQSRAWRQEWWGESFPLVLIVSPRAEHIRTMADEMFRVIDEPKGIIKALKGGGRDDSMRKDYAVKGFLAGGR